MTTISEFLERNFKRQKQARLEKLQKINAPQVIIDNLKKEIETDGGVSGVGKIKQFGHLEFASFETKKYRKGTGITFTLNDGSIVKMIPGPYSIFLTDEDK